MEDKELRLRAVGLVISGYSLAPHSMCSAEQVLEDAQKVFKWLSEGKLPDNSSE